MKLHKMLYAFALCFLNFELCSLSTAITFAAEQGKPESFPNDGPYVVGNGVNPPELVYQVLPPYTEEARKAKIEGVVLIQAIIRKNGAIDSFKIIKYLGYGLDDSAIITIASKWRFKPGTLKGQPVDVITNIEVRFSPDQLLATIIKPHWEPGPDGSMKGSGYGNLDVITNIEVRFSPDQLLATIFKPHWERSTDGSMKGSGYGNLKEAASLKGFTYICSCKGKFEAGDNPVNWIEPQSRLEITSYEIGAGDARNPQKCELKVTMQDFIYEVKDGSLIKLLTGAMEQQGQSKRQLAKIQIAEFDEAMLAFAFDVGRYPTTIEGLGVLVRNPSNRIAWAGPYLKKALPMDPWGKPYRYRFPGRHGDYDIFSLGPDGIEGTDDDVCSWK